MKVDDRTIPAVTFEAFADANDLVLVLTERTGEFCSDPSRRYYARFADAEVMDRGCLLSESGDGATKEDAIKDYARAILGKRLAIGAYTDNRREIQCPNEWAKGAT